MSSHTNFSLLESLPQDVLGEILSRVASSSVEDIRNCLTVSKTIGSAVEDYRVFKSLKLRPQTMNPLVTFVRYQNLMAKSLNVDNPSAHYIVGIKQYFIFDNRSNGFSHLKKSYEGGYDNGTYLYGMLLLVTGNLEEGKTILSSLDWETSKCRVDRAWREVKRSLMFVFVIMKPEYTATLKNNRPPQSCHRHDMDNVCPKCIHYKQMRKFLAFIQ